MPLNTVAGERFYIGGVLSDKNADFVAADFNSQTWVEVDGLASRPPIGDTASEIATDLINRGRTIVQKGTRRSPAGEWRFAIVNGDAGQAAMTLAQTTKANYAMQLVKSSTAAAKVHAVTVTIASPGVFSWTAHALALNTPISFATTGALPTGLTAGTTYYVKTAPDADTFTVSATAGGTVINTTGTQSGTHTATTAPVGETKQFIGLVMSDSDVGGEANTASMVTYNVAPNSNIVTLPAAS